jgi:hypothetical protein
VVEVHRLIAQAVVLYYALVGVWGVFLGVRKVQQLSSAYRGALIIGVVLGVMQAAIGIVLLLTVRSPHDNLHFLYGASIILALPLVASYIVDKKFSRPLAYGLCSLFMSGLAIRAITTGG